MIEFENINKIVKNSMGEDTHILNDISLSFDDKGLYFLSGKSGSGKTSLLNILCGISIPSSGDFIYNNAKIDYHQSHSIDIIHKESSYVFQNSFFISNLSIVENIRIIGIRDEKEINKILEFVDLYKCKNTKVSLLSGGEKQRLSIAIALIKGSKYIVLDEPTASLDHNNKIKIMELLSQIARNKLVIMASHDQEIINEYADYIYEIDEGKITNYINVNNDKLEINIFNSNKDYIFLIYEKLKKHNEDYIYVNDVRYELLKDNLLVSLENIFDKYANEKVIVEFPNEKSVKDDFTFDKCTKPDFTFRLQLRYALSLIFQKCFKSILLVILFTLSFVLLSFQLTTSSLKKYDVDYRNFSTNNIPYIEIYKNDYNPNLKEELSIYKGKDLKNELINNKIDFLEFNESSISNIEIKLYVLDSNIIFDGYQIDVIGKKEIITSELVKYLMKSNDFSISNYEFEDVNFVAFDNRIDYDLVNAYQSRQLTNVQNDLLNQKYFVAFISSEYYLELLTNMDGYYEKMPSNEPTCNNYDYYSKLFCQYNHVKYPDLKDNQIIVSSSLLFNLNSTKEELIGSTVYNFDLRKSKNYKKYVDCLNLYDIYNELEVIDVVEDSDRSIYVSEDYYNKIIEESMNYLYFSINAKNYDNVKKICELNYDFPSNLVYSSNNFLNLISDQFKPILLAFNIIISAISMILLFIFSNNSYNSNIKEVCLMKSYGIRVSKIVNSFLLYNLSILIVAFILSFILYVIGINLINPYLMRENVLDINFNVFSIDYLVIIVLLISVILISIISTILPNYKIKKYDLYYLLKE